MSLVESPALRKETDATPRNAGRSAEQPPISLCSSLPLSPISSRAQLSTSLVSPRKEDTTTLFLSSRRKLRAVVRGIWIFFFPRLGFLKFSPRTYVILISKDNKSYQFILHSLYGGHVAQCLEAGGAGARLPGCKSWRCSVTLSNDLKPFCKMSTKIVTTS